MRLKVKNRICPTCKESLNYFTKPREKDYTVCLKCGTVLLFKANLDVRSLTIAELAQIPNEINQDLLTIRKMVKKPENKVCH